MYPSTAVFVVVCGFEPVPSVTLNTNSTGNPMIACNAPDIGWFHFSCIGITEEPNSDEEWYCEYEIMYMIFSLVFNYCVLLRF